MRFLAAVAVNPTSMSRMVSVVVAWLSIARTLASSSSTGGGSALGSGGAHVSANDFSLDSALLPTYFTSSTSWIDSNRSSSSVPKIPSGPSRCAMSDLAAVAVSAASTSSTFRSVVSWLSMSSTFASSSSGVR